MRPIVLIPILLAIVLATVSSLRAQVAEKAEPPLLRVELSESDLIKEPEFIELLILGKKIGWMKQSLKRGKLDGEDVIYTEVEYFQKLMNEGEPMTSGSTDIEYFSAKPPYRFVGATSTSEQNGFKSKTSVRRSPDKEGEFFAELTGGRAVRKREVGKLDYQLGDFLAAEIWSRRDLEPGDAMRMREFDFKGHLEVHIGTNRITKLLPEKGEGAVERLGRKGRYELEYYEPKSKIRANFVVDPNGTMLHGRIGGAMEVRLTGEKEARKIDAELDLFESSLIKIEESIGDPSKVRALVIEITGKGIEAIPSSAMQSPEYDKLKKSVQLKIGLKHGKKVAVTEEQRAEALEETSTYPTKDPQVVALAEKAIGRATRSKARIKRLVDFVDRFIIDDYSNEPLTVNDIIETRRGDCSEHSQLFVTLARAAGIPAREVGGFIYGEGAENTFGGHAWCEVEVDGHWYPVDPTWGETVINATHIRLSGERPSSEEMDLFMGQMKIRVISVTTKQGTRRFTKGE